MTGALARAFAKLHWLLMALKQKLKAWEKAGLIDAGQAARIAAFETSHEHEGRPILLWAIIGLGLFALVLGVMLLVAANWDLIPNWLKLAVHMSLVAGAAGAVIWAHTKRRLWAKEGWLFLLGGLVFGGIGLQSQVYQLTGPYWQPLLLWLVLMTPALFLMGQTRLTGHGWSMMLLLMLSTLAWDYQDRHGPWLLIHGLWMAGPYILLSLAALPQVRDREFARSLQDTGLVVLMAAASIAHFGWAERILPEEATRSAVRLLVPAMFAAIFWALGRQGNRIPQPLLLALACGPMIATALVLLVPHQNDWTWRFVGFLVFIAMWGWVARAASQSGWTLLFSVSIAAIALRLFIVYIELFGSLASTGTGLVVGGLLVVLLAWIWHRIIARRNRQAVEA